MAGRIPFDAFCVAAICDEVSQLIGAKLQGVRQPDAYSIVIELYHRGSAYQLLLCSHPEFFRMHFVTRKPVGSGVPPVFCATLRSRLDSSTLMGVSMQHSDRVVILDFGDHRLVAELMGKHSNLVLIDSASRCIAAAKWVPPTQSSRPVLPNTIYQLPPVLDQSKPTLTSFRGALVHSKFNLNQADLEPGLSLGHGAYPANLTEIYPNWLPKPTFSIACEQAYTDRIGRHEFDSLQRNLTGQLERAILGREVALQELVEAREMGGRAGMWQRHAELLMTYASNLPPGSSSIKLPDYTGNEVAIKLNPELSGKENSLALFEKAKKAKNRAGIILDQIRRLEGIKNEIEGYLFATLEARHKRELEEIKEKLQGQRLLNPQQQHSKNGKTERPFDGQRIRELVGPRNHRVLYGENAEANDYLTLRVAKSNDWWLHVRGHTSAHVLIPTLNKPELTPREVLEFAAKVAVQNSNQKHAGYVAVDYTLKKYVRRTKGSPKGTVIYTHEKTLHVEA